MSELALEIVRLASSTVVPLLVQAVPCRAAVVVTFIRRHHLMWQQPWKLKGKKNGKAPLPRASVSPSVTALSRDSLDFFPTQ